MTTPENTMELNVIYNCDAITGLRRLPDNSVDCIVTSPPYWQMRDYGIEPTLWGGSDVCEHRFDDNGYCTECGGWLGQLGLEPKRDDFIFHLLLVFDECRRILKPTGTLWVNLGDTYSNPNKYSLKSNPQSISKGNNRNYVVGCKARTANDIQGKSLCNIPNAFADTMIHRGWILRNEIIWHKPSCMPSSARDRFTIDFEKMFFFVKSRRYRFNQQFEPYAGSTLVRYKSPMRTVGKCVYYQQCGYPKGMMRTNPNGRNMSCVWRVPYEPSKESHYAMFPTRLVRTPIEAGSPVGGVVLDPFIGSGTTAMVAKQLGRNYIGIEYNPEYAAICRRRLATMQ